ncbi:hypothetical protein K7432_017188, partial [Basidiobolus ranarum]
MPSAKLTLSAIAVVILASYGQANDICAGVPQWNSGEVYTGSNQVTYSGKLWKAKWWTLNSEPGNNQEDVWADMGTCGVAPKPTADVGSGVCSGVNSWNPGVAYVGSNQVTYNGNLWKAKWWTLNNEPGNNAEQVWVNLGPCDEIATTTANSTPNPTTSPVPNPTTISTPNPTTSSTPNPTTSSTPNPTTSSAPTPPTSLTPNPTT